jgi:hypothetical protein
MKIKSHGANMTEVLFSDRTSLFFSYETPVGAYIPNEGFYITDKKWSRTTSKHINKWLEVAGNRDYKTKSQDWFYLMKDCCNC